ncbi:MAG: GNAT family N-acetyltransferase [Hyphomonas sp.]|uniref:GNAT family N-acetyltransferase n=1 Tax=Hyphomonas sp. TaxID=87 RepID=UPI00352910C0
MTSRQTAERDYDVKVVHPRDLAPAEADAWTRLCDAHEDYDSPLVRPAFAQIAGAGRDDARVALISDAAGLACAFAFYIRPFGRAWPIGAPFHDYTALVMRQDAVLSIKNILVLAGVSALTTPTLLDPWDRFADCRRQALETQVVRLAGRKPSEYLELQRQAFPKRFKNFRRLDSRMKRDGHELKLKWGSLDPAAAEQLYAVKSAQFVSSGFVDLTKASRSRPILDAVAASPHGFQISLWSGERVVSGHFGIRLGPVFHPWIAAYDPDFSEYSPGNLMLMRAIAAMPEMGLEVYDLAEGHDHYKKYYTNTCRKVWSVEETAPGASGALVHAGHLAWALAGGASGRGPVSRLRRRLDQSDMCESRLSLRLADLATALKRRRGVDGPVPHESAMADV